MFFVGFFTGVITAVAIGFMVGFYQKSQRKDKLLADLQGMDFEEKVTLQKKKDV